MASKRTEKWKKHHMDITYGAWYLPYEYQQHEYTIKSDDTSGTLGYCPKCKLVYDSIQIQLSVDGEAINTRKFYFYHDFPNLVKDSKHKPCYKCLGKPCKIVDRK
jgi:hypothetical protein